MATQAQNAQQVLDALADSLGKSLTQARKALIVEEFTNQVGSAATNEEKAQLFNESLARIIVKVGRKHERNRAVQAAQADFTAAEDGAASGDIDVVDPAPAPVAPAPVAPAEDTYVGEPEPKAQKKLSWWRRFLNWLFG